MTTLKEITLNNAQYVRNSNIEVTINSSHSWVDFKRDGETVLFLQGDEADKFSDEWTKLTHRLSTVSFEDCMLSVAYPYLDCIE